MLTLINEIKKGTISFIKRKSNCHFLSLCNKIQFYILLGRKVVIKFQFYMQNKDELAMGIGFSVLNEVNLAMGIRFLKLFLDDFG